MGREDCVVLVMMLMPHQVALLFSLLRRCRPLLWRLVLLMLLVTPLSCLLLSEGARIESVGGLSLWLFVVCYLVRIQ